MRSVVGQGPRVGHVAGPGRSVGHAWWLKALILLAFFTPPVVTRGFDPAATSSVVQAVLVHPVLTDLTGVVILGKALLLGLVIIGLTRPALMGRYGWGYYALALLVVAPGQNVGVTERFGTAWLVGNTVIQLVVAAFVALDAWRGWSRTGPVRWERAWVLPLMALAWLFPYTVTDGLVRPGLTAAALVNEAGVTYCMITPVVLGLMVLTDDGVRPGTLSVAAWTGLLFGVANMVTWFVVAPGSWWMGVLHLPLLLICGYAAWCARRARRGLGPGRPARSRG